MGNGATTEKSVEKIKAGIVSIDITSPFETLASLPTSLSRSQCIVYNNNEIIICGGVRKRACYSYHTLKNQYKLICSYPDNVTLVGHCVVKLKSSSNNNNNTNEITLLSFGGMFKHTLVMKYVSVWESHITKKRGCNEWLPFIDQNNKRLISIGRYHDVYCGLRAIVGGNSNNLLFITYSPKNIDIFDLNTLQYINHSTLPIDNDIHYHCFVLSKKEKNKDVNKMLLFFKNTGLSIIYNEKKNNFQFDNIRVCTTIKSFFSYGYVCINDVILFFGGDDDLESRALKDVYKYSIKQNKWMKFEQALPISLSGFVAILDKNNTYVHIIGGFDGKNVMATHMKVKMGQWMNEETETEKLWIEEEERKKEIEKTKAEVEKMEKGNGFSIKSLK
ncbi:hypothetical protein RFI_13377, partial [Reticulomyxa filosa]